jgi:hypothetical protein
MLTLLGIAVIYMGFRMTTEGKTWFKKWKESREIAKERKFEKMRQSTGCPVKKFTSFLVFFAVFWYINFHIMDIIIN